jgi:hypothetical protein
MTYSPAIGISRVRDSSTWWSIVIVIAIHVLLVLWLLSLLLHPFTTCSSCNGSPRSYGAVATRSFRLCASCGGSGRRLRVGARVWPQNRE